MEKNDFDLPNPKPRRSLSEEEYKQHRISLYKKLFVFSVLYGSLHKIIIPLFLSQTSVLVRDYTLIDPWALPSLILAFYIIRFKRFDGVASLLAGFLIAYAVWDALAIFNGEHRGWLAWSHAISSLPQAFMAIVLLSAHDRTRSLRSAWIGAAIAVVVFVAMKVTSPGQQELNDLTTPKVETTLPEIGQEACGAQEFEMSLRKIRNFESIQLQDCGLTPAVFLFKTGAVPTFNRTTKGAINLHFVFYDSTGTRRRQTNRILKPSESQSLLAEMKFNHGEMAAVLYSDTAPQIGKVLIVNESILNDYVSAGVTKARTLVLRKSDEL